MGGGGSSKNIPDEILSKQARRRSTGGVPKRALIRWRNRKNETERKQTGSVSWVHRSGEVSKGSGRYIRTLNDRTRLGFLLTLGVFSEVSGGGVSLSFKRPSRGTLFFKWNNSSLSPTQQTVGQMETDSAYSPPLSSLVSKINHKNVFKKYRDDLGRGRLMCKLNISTITQHMSV